MDAAPGSLAMTDSEGAWRLVCFGIFAVDTGKGASFPELGRKARALLAWLAISHARVARERVFGLLWSERGEEQARQSLRQTLTELRQFTAEAGGGPLFDGDRDLLALAPGRVTTDIAALRRDADAGDLSAVAAGLGEFPSCLLEDLDGVDPAFDDWLVLERPRQHDARIATALAAARQASHAGRHDDALRLLGVLRGHDACHEGVAHAAMEAAYGCGDRDTLRHVLDQHRIALQRDLDCDVAPETSSLFQRLMCAEWPQIEIMPRASAVA